VIYKGYDRPEQLEEARSVFRDLPHLGIEVDDTGFDIGAYLKIARQIDHEYLCFLNSFTELEADGWLGMLHRYASLPHVGIAGAMGSYESLSESVALLSKVAHICQCPWITYDRRIVHYFAFVVSHHRSEWLVQGDRTRMAPALTRLRQWIRYKSRLGFRRYWQSLIRPGGPMAPYACFPGFPNPHIRSNGFMIARKRLLKECFGPIQTKLDACAFESSANSLTTRLRKVGLATIVVGRNGNGYDVAEWPKSETFRLGNQSNLLLSDNQSRNFTAMTTGTRATHVRMTWGDYLDSAPADFPHLGFACAINREFVDPVRVGRPNAVKLAG
jgi:hypothetical protein